MLCFALRRRHTHAHTLTGGNLVFLLLRQQELAPVVVWVAFGVAAAQAVWHGWLIRRREREGCFAAFRANHWLGFTLYAGVVLAGLAR